MKHRSVSIKPKPVKLNPELLPEAQIKNLLKLRAYLIESVCYLSNEVKEIDTRLEILEVIAEREKELQRGSSTT